MIKNELLTFFLPKLFWMMTSEMTLPAWKPCWTELLTCKCAQAQTNTLTKHKNMLTFLF